MLLRPLLPLLLAAASVAAPIDRQALVTRHNVVRTEVAALRFAPEGPVSGPLASADESRFAPLQVGNGRFAFSVDVTGLQTFIPCQTMAHWAWHTEPPPAGVSPEDFQWIEFPTASGRHVPYSWVALSPDDAHADQEVPMSDEQRRLAFWIRANPHLLNLARIGLELRHEDGSAATLNDLQDVRQELDLWSGVITSRFRFDGEAVTVLTRAHPEEDAIAVRITSPLVAAGRLHVSWRFPYGDTRKQTTDVGDWSRPERHQTRPERQGETGVRLWRTLDADQYTVDVTWSEGATWATASQPHHYTLQQEASGETLAFVAEFNPAPGGTAAAWQVPDEAAVHAASERHWPEFWRSGAALELSATDDPRARELERRVVLSQYLMAVQEAGPLPPQEAGLVNLGWHGKFHLEMVLWHQAHYALWNRWPLLERSVDYYVRTLPAARELAARQGYPGARWPKMVGPDARQSPGNVNPFLIWQQPHPLFFAELEWRERPTAETLERWREVVFATAEFMAALPVPRPDSPHLHLGPPLKTVSENTPAASTWDPAFELSYWRFGLRIAQAWRERLGLPPEPQWAQVLTRLAPLPERNGRYLLSASQPDTYEAWHWEHPAVVGLYGLLPGDGAQRETAGRTLDAVQKHWSFDRVWGWDFPMLAMSAARLGRPEEAVNLLLHPSPNFQFADNGLATGGPWPYFPSNGGLLYAVALMAGGWDGAPDRATPGFPAGWSVRAEGFRRAP